MSSIPISPYIPLLAPRLITLSLQLVPLAISSLFIDGQQILGDDIMIAREHDQERDHSRRHHSNPFRSIRVLVDQSIVVRSNSLLLQFGIPVERRQIHITRSFVDPLICASAGLKALVDHNRGKREEESVETGRVFAEFVVWAFEELFEDQLGVRKVGAFGSKGRYCARIRCACFAHFGVPRIIVAYQSEHGNQQWSTTCQRSQDHFQYLHRVVDSELSVLLQ